MPADRGRAAAPRLRHGRRHDPPGGRHQRARRELHEGLLRRPGDGRAPALQGQAEPPPARPAPVRAGRARRRDPARREGGGRLGSTCVSPRLGPIALALVRREAEPGRRGAGGRRAGRGRRAALRALAEPRATREPARALARQPAAGPLTRGAGLRPRSGGVLDLPAPPPERRRPSTCASCASSSRRRAGPRGRRLGSLAARLRPARAAARLLLPALVPRGGRGHRERARRGRRADRVEPLRRAAPGRADDHAGDPPRAPAPAPALHARRELVQGLSGRGDARQQDRARGRAPRERPAAARATRAGSCSCSPRARRARASCTGSATGCAASAAAASCAPRCARACRSCRSR